MREEVREGRSFSPDEFAIALEQVVAGIAPEDYRDPAQFFTRTLKEHAGMVLRRLVGRTENTSPVLTLITQFGGGKTHTLTALHHLARAGVGASDLPGIADLLSGEGLAEAPAARVGVFVGNAWETGGRHRGSILHASSLATRALPRSAQPRRRYRRARRRSAGFSPPWTPRCCCCSTRC